MELLNKYIFSSTINGKERKIKKGHIFVIIILLKLYIKILRNNNKLPNEFWEIVIYMSMNNKNIMNTNEDPTIRENNFEHAKTDWKKISGFNENDLSYRNLGRNMKRKIIYRKLMKDMIPFLENKYVLKLTAKQSPDEEFEKRKFETDDKGNEEIKVLRNYRLKKNSSTFVQYPINYFENRNFEFDILNTDSAIYFQYFYTINFLKSNNNIFLEDIRSKKLIQLFIENSKELKLTEDYFLNRISSLIKFDKKSKNPSNFENLINELFTNTNILEKTNPPFHFVECNPDSFFDQRQIYDNYTEIEVSSNNIHEEQILSSNAMNSEMSEKSSSLINYKEILKKKYCKIKGSARLAKHIRKMNDLSDPISEIKYLIENIILNKYKKLDEGIYIHIYKDGLIKILDEENISNLRNSTIDTSYQVNFKLNNFNKN